jgi:hypothetical protein
MAVHTIWVDLTRPIAKTIDDVPWCAEVISPQWLMNYLATEFEPFTVGLGRSSRCGLSPAFGCRSRLQRCGPFPSGHQEATTSAPWPQIFIGSCTGVY